MRREPSVLSGEFGSRRNVASVLRGVAPFVLALGCLAVGPSVACGAFDVPVPNARRAAMAVRGWWVAGPAPGDDASSPRRAGAPADSGRGRRWSVEVSACELYGLPEARAWSAVAERRGPVSLSVGAGRFGWSVYEERHVSASAASLLDGGLSAVVGLRVLGLSAPGVKELWCQAFDAGMAAYPLKHLRLSCEWSNIGGASVGDSPVAQSSVFRAEIWSDAISVQAAIVVEPFLTPSSSFGIELRASPAFALRAGSATEPDLFAAGFGVTAPGSFLGASGCAVDVAWQWNPELGASAFVTLSLSL